MEVLLDTCTFLWIIMNSDQLHTSIREIIAKPENTIFLSAASTWEIAIKYSLGKLPLPERPEIYIPKQRKTHFIETLPISEEASLHTAKLPEIHNDPFDRILVAQSIVAGYPIMTPDSLIRQYPVKVIWN